MKYHQRAALCVFYLSSGLAVAGTMGSECGAGSDGSACVSRGFGFGAQALYLRANLPNLEYLGSTSKGDVITTYHEYFISKKFSYGLGFKLDTFYHFGAGKDWTLNWYHYAHQSLQTITGPDTVNVYDTPFRGTVVTTLKPKWDAVNLEFGKRIDIEAWGHVRFHGGLQYANLAMDNITTGTGTAVPLGISRTNHSSFEGIGPRVGADLSYDFWRGIGLYLNGAGAILSGHNAFQRQAITYSGVSFGTFSDMNSGTANEVVTEFEYKLGGSYSHPFRRGYLRLDAGWMWADYLGAIEIADSSHHGRTKGGNFAVQGAYAGLKWTGELG